MLNNERHDWDQTKDGTHPSGGHDLLDTNATSGNNRLSSIVKTSIVIVILMIISSLLVMLTLSSGLVERTPPPQQVTETNHLVNVIHQLEAAKLLPAPTTTTQTRHTRHAKSPAHSAKAHKKTVKHAIAKAKKAPRSPQVVKSKQPLKVVQHSTIAQTTPAASVTPQIKQARFIKLSANGDKLDKNAAKWSCVEDTSTGEIWEVKSNDGGLRDKNNMYSWLVKNNGVADGGRCKGGIDCDTESYVNAINKQKLCGYSDWRLPTRDEMETLIDYRNNTPHAKTPHVMIDAKYFPHTKASWYWTDNVNASHQNYAWYILFRNGLALSGLKDRPRLIRLVRGGMITQSVASNDQQ